MALPTPTALLAASGTVLAVNAAWRQLTGDDSGTDIGRPVWRRFAPAERSNVAALIERAHDSIDEPGGVRPRVGGTQLRDAAGRHIDVALRVSAVRHSGAPVLVVEVQPLAGERRTTHTRRGTGDRQLALATIARLVATGTDLHSISESVIDAIARTTGCPLVGLWRRASRAEPFVLLDGVGFGEHACGRLTLDGDPGGLADHTVRSRGVVVIGGPAGTAARVPRVLSDRGLTSGVAVALQGIAGSDGLLTVSATHNQPLHPDDVRFLAIVGDLLTMAMQRGDHHDLVTREGHRTARLAQRLAWLEHRHRVALELSGLHEWSWIRPEPVTAGHYLDPAPRWSLRVCLDGGPQAVVDCAVADDVEPTVQAINAALAHGDDLDVTVRLRTADGVTPVRLRATVEREADGTAARVSGLAAVHRDAPAAATAEPAAPPAPDQTGPVPVAAGQVTHVRRTAHDLNNLLAAILGTAEQLVEARAGRRHATAIVHAARRARVLVADLQPGRKLEQHPLAGPYDIAEVIDQLRPLLHGIVGHDVRLVFQLERGTRIAQPSRDLFERMLLDLVANSRDALGNDGTVVIATDSCSQVERAADDRPSPPAGRWARLRVCDNGVGMSRSARDRAFEPGFTSKRDRGHSGLGLAALRDTVTAVGGAVSIDSAPGRGTVVDVYLPLAVRPAARLEPLRTAALPRRTGAPAVRAAGAPARIALVVDDEPALRDLLGQLLSRMGFTTMQAADGQGALTAAERLDHLDLVVSDLRIPHMNGLRLAQRIRQVHPHVAVVLVTGAEPHPIADGAVRVLRKPFEWLDLREAVRELLPAQMPALEMPRPAAGGR